MEESEIGVGVEGVSSVTNSIASTLKAERLSCIDVSLNQFIQITHAVNNEPPPVVPVQPVQPVRPVQPSNPSLGNAQTSDILERNVNSKRKLFI